MVTNTEKQADQNLLNLHQQTKIIVKSESHERILELKLQLGKLYPGAKVIANATDPLEHSSNFYFGILI